MCRYFQVVTCNLYGYTHKEKEKGSNKRRKVKNNLKCGCTWAIRFSRKKRMQKYDSKKDKEPIIITSFSPVNPHLCQTGLRQFTFVNKIYIKYSKEKSLILHQLVSQMYLKKIILHPPLT